MASPQDSLIGKLAVQQGFLTEEEVEECVRAQAAEGRPLGETMRALGYVSRAQLENLLRIQQEQLAQVNPQTQRRLVDELFGPVAVREGLTTQEEVNECLREQATLATQGKQVALGALMCERGYLSTRQVQRILELQKKALMVCPGCKAQYNAADFDPDKEFKCPADGAALELVKEEPASVAVKGNITATQTRTPTPAPMPAPPRPAPAPPPPPPAPAPPTAAPSAAYEELPGAEAGGLVEFGSGTVESLFTCPDCSNQFAAEPDSDGFVSCPKCERLFHPNL